jgi:hypothetical protein
MFCLSVYPRLLEKGLARLEVLKVAMKTRKRAMRMMTEIVMARVETRIVEAITHMSMETGGRVSMTIRMAGLDLLMVVLTVVEDIQSLEGGTILWRNGIADCQYLLEVWGLGNSSQDPIVS